MSTITAASQREQRVTVRSLSLRKGRGEPFSMLTAYDATFARIFDAAGIDVLLVGDSVGNTVQGHETTLPVTLDEMLYHTRLVARTVRRPLVVGDMPFGSYQVSAEEAVRNAVRFVKEGGAAAVKLEGGRRMRETIARIVDAEIPVMGHIGLTPQSVHAMGGFKVQGRQHGAALALVDDAKALAAAGCFAIVLEGVPDEVARLVTETVDVPTIGIGAGRYCDGQVLVFHDVLGIEDRIIPKFVRRYAGLKADAVEAVARFADDVRVGRFPSDDETYHLSDEVAESLGLYGRVEQTA
jgi:3-methyl-2-oxobutanoate hydroxymethyltransferase